LVLLLFQDAKLQPLFIMAVMDFSGKVSQFADNLNNPQPKYKLHGLEKSRIRQ
jgi:hypothetical protein